MSPTAQRVVLVTGCSTGGLGFHLCERFADRGCLVYATSRRLETMQGFRNGTIRTLAMDILEEAGKIDILVNNAGALAIGPIAEATMEHVQNAFNLNTFSVIRVSNAVIPSMAERRQGLIINIGSIAGHITLPWNSIYCASKAALQTFSEALGMECKPLGIKVMLVAPGGVKTNISKNQAATFKLSPATMFKDYEPSMLRLMHASEDKNSITADEFAGKVVDKALRANPPPYMTLGYLSTRFTLFQWLPRQFILGRLYQELVHKVA